MEFQIGQSYKRPCAVMRLEDGREYAVPVFAHLHADAQFGFPEEHYHIDGRFELEPRMAHRYKLKNGHTATVICPAEPDFLRIEYRQLICVRGETGLTFPAEPNAQQTVKLALYRDWYAGFVGQTCPGKRCPHFGTELLAQGELLVCPMHGLRADAETLEIVPLTDQPEK